MDRQSWPRERHILLGQRGDVPVCLSAMDVFANLQRGASQRLAEAMPVGLPCVATTAGDAAIVTGDTAVGRTAGRARAGARPPPTCWRCPRRAALLGARAKMRIAENSIAHRGAICNSTRTSFEADTDREFVKKRFWTTAVTTSSSTRRRLRGLATSKRTRARRIWGGRQLDGVHQECLETTTLRRPRPVQRRVAEVGPATTAASD